MSLQYTLFTISNSLENPKPVFPIKMPEGYSSLSETDKLVCEKLLRDCYSAACTGKKFLEITEKVSPDVLTTLGIPKKTVIFYWNTPGTETN